MNSVVRTLWFDGKHAIRLYGQTPRASLIAILILAVGLAFVCAFLSLYVDQISRPYVGFEQGSRIATIGLSNGSSEAGIPYAALERMADEMTAIESVAWLYRRSMSVGPNRERSDTAFVSNGFFDGLRPRLALGRGFEFSDHAPDAEPVVVLSYQYWQQYFDGDPNVLGTLLEVAWDPLGSRPPGEPEPDSVQHRVVGVMAESASDIHFPGIAVWIPVEPAVALQLIRSMFGSRAPAELLSGLSARSYVRRDAGVSVQALLNELNTRYSGENSPIDRLRSGYSMDAIDGIVSSFAEYRDTRRQLELFLLSSLLLAFVAALNVSLFLLARAPGRRREFGIRLAVGAPMRRLVRQVATESCLFIVVAAILGLVMSGWLAASLSNLPLLQEADWRDATLFDWRVLGMVAVVVLVLSLVVSLAPILRIKRLGIAVSSKHVTARASLAQQLAGTAQIAVAGAVGGAAIAFGWYIGLLMFGDQGYELTDRYYGSSVAVRASVSDEATFVELARRREAIEAIPGVTAVAFGAPVPTFGVAGRARAIISHPDDPANTISAVMGSAEQRYIDVLGLTVLYGRVPELRSEQGVLVNQTLARALWGRDDVVGERIPAGSRLGYDGIEVVGVLEDVSFDHPAAAVPPIAWNLIGSSEATGAETIIHAQLTAAELQRELDRIAEAGALEPPIRPVEPLKVRYNALTAPDRARGLITMASAVLVVFLTAFGFYGTQRYLVAAGRREHAIRLAIGAGPKAVGRLVVGRSVLFGLPGLAAGGLLAFVVAAWLRDDFLSGEVSPALVTVCLVGGLTLLLESASIFPRN